jgi:hypothetical protein
MVVIIGNNEGQSIIKSHWFDLEYILWFTKRITIVEHAKKIDAKLINFPINNINI